MSKLIMMRGLPGSGKSTKSKEIVESNENTVRLNRDLLREMLHFSKYSKSNEKKIIQAETVLAVHFLENDIDVIIDDTNLVEKNLLLWEEVAMRTKKSFEVITIDTPIRECIKRDKERERTVGEDIIINMNKRKIF